MLLVVKMRDKIELFRIMSYMIRIYILAVLLQRVSSNNSKRIVPDVQTEFYYFP